MIALLSDLKRDHSAIAVKAEFEDEGASMEELVLLRDIASHAGLGLTLKIGGAGALRDLKDARLLGAGTIVAPMIESQYALKKFTAAIEQVFPDIPAAERPRFHINIETAAGSAAAGEILRPPDIRRISGVILGRSDMARSLGLDAGEVNSAAMRHIALQLLSATSSRRLSFGIGGNICGNSVKFMRGLPEPGIDSFETRKVVFRCPGAFKSGPAAGIQKALRFELLWLRHKQAHYGRLAAEDTGRIRSIAAKCSFKPS
ncbi:MAG: hypothetical protein A2089_12655 [Elusimicrobia bacterium GWD2_63_28]|nr:MAG: hypothetical protein A2089_12655 [Elusimicrobia bacterium GWD2_63_28]